MKDHKLGTQPIPKLIIGMALPVIFSMIVQGLYNIIDSFFVSNLSDKALTSVTLAFPIQLIIIGVFVGLGTGINSNISRRLGENRLDEAQSVSEHGIFMALILSVVVGIAGYFVATSYFTWFTNDPTIISGGRVYTQIISIFAVFRIVAYAGSSSLQGSGEMIKPMIAQIVGAVTNIVLDPILIFGMFGIKGMGIRGAATATVISQAVAMLYIFWNLLNGKQLIQPKIKRFQFSASTTKNIIAVGLPSAIMQCIGSLMLGGINMILSKFGSSALAVIGVYFQLQSLIYMPIFGLAVGAMPVFGFSFGAKDSLRLIHAIRFTMMVAVSFMLVSLLLFQILPQQLLEIFHATPEMIAIGVTAIRTISYIFPLVAITFILSTTFNAVGKGVLSLIISLTRQLFILLPAAYFLSEFIGIQGVWYGFVLSECVGLVVSIGLFTQNYKNIVSIDKTTL